MRKTLISAAVFAAFVTAHAAGGFGGGGGDFSANLTLSPTGTSNSGGAVVTRFCDITGRTPRSAALVGGETTLIVLYLGDSISANSGPSAYTTTQAKNQVLNVCNGNVYDYADPTLGAATGSGSYMGMVADKLISAAKFTRVISITPSLGGAASFDYSKSGNLNASLRASCIYARGLGWPIGGSSGAWRFGIVWAIGTNDNALGVGSTTYTNNSLNAFQSLRDYGCNGDIFINKMTMVGNTVNSTLQTAQTNLVNGSDRFTGADWDSLTGGTNRVGDGTHMTLTGEDNGATLLKNIFVAHY